MSGSMTFTPSFTRKMLDECSGLYYFNARWYDSEMGRFTTSDPARDGGNWWIYCRNSPLTHIDWTGLKEDNAKVIVIVERNLLSYKSINDKKYRTRRLKAGAYISQAELRQKK